MAMSQSMNLVKFGMKILQTNNFKRKVKNLHKDEKIEVDKAIKKIQKNTEIGEAKKGDLLGVWVYKFKMKSKKILLAYSFDEKTIILLALGSHENFYRDLK